MSFRGVCIHDVIEDDTGDKPIGSQIVYFDFDTEDEAYRFGSLLADSKEFDQIVRKLATMACEHDGEEEH